jgi:hypothetical protein
MPVTPFHFGLGALAKSIAPKRFSFQVFFLSQVLMDIQPGINLILGWRPLHGWTHTYLGAVCVGMLAALLWRIWEKIRPDLFATSVINNFVLIASCLFGTLSHVWLDSQYHQEMWRLTPIFARLLAPNEVEKFCLAVLGIAGIIFVIRWLVARIRREKVRT